LRVQRRECPGEDPACAARFDRHAVDSCGAGCVDVPRRQRIDDARRAEEQLALAHGSVIKAVAMIILGLLVGLVGTDGNTGGTRFTFGITELTDGIDVATLAIGIFGIGEIITNLAQPQETRSLVAQKISRLWPTRDDFRRAWPAVLRGTALGSVLGVLPGGGATLSSFAAYALEKKSSKRPEQFGRGAVEGVAGPESANNAGAQTSFIPMLTLGIPGNAVMALMIGALTIHGIQPGPQIMTERPQMFLGLIASMWIGNAILLTINLPPIGLWVHMLKVSYRFLYLALLLFCGNVVYTVNNAPAAALFVAFFAGIDDDAADRGRRAHVKSVELRRTGPRQVRLACRQHRTLRCDKRRKRDIRCSACAVEQHRQCDASDGDQERCVGDVAEIAISCPENAREVVQGRKLRQRPIELSAK